MGHENGGWMNEDQRDSVRSARSEAIIAFADLVIRDVAELPDRSSPKDWPEAMLVTQSELRSIIFNRISGVL